MTSSRIVIVGRPNVGKSTLFNRLLGSRRAIVHNRPGVTRDRIAEAAIWYVKGAPYPIELVDTGGLGGETFDAEISRQVAIALDGAAAVLLVLDAREGLTEKDRLVMDRLRRSEGKAPIIGVANKMDVESLEPQAAEFYSMGLDHVVAVSAEHNRGIEELKERVLKESRLEPEPEAESAAAAEKNEDLPRIAIVGRPNVGKSTLINTLLGQERMITSPIAGTTSDSVDSIAELGGRRFLLIDTAGVRRKSKTAQGIEVLSVVQTKKALERADLAILVLDGEEGLSDQDEKIAGMIEDAGCSFVLAMNKWDTQLKTGFSKDEAADRVRKQIRFLKYAPIVFMSALRGQGVGDLGGLMEEVLSQRSLKLQTKEFTEWLRRESEIHNPMNAKFYLCHQTSRHPPTFSCHVSDPKKITFSLKRHLVNAMRDKWGYMGTPIRLHFVQAEGRPARRGSKR